VEERAVGVALGAGLHRRWNVRGQFPDGFGGPGPKHYPIRVISPGVTLGLTCARCHRRFVFASEVQYSSSRRRYACATWKCNMMINLNYGVGEGAEDKNEETLEGKKS